MLRNSIENSRQSAERMRGELSEQTERAAGIAAQIDEHKTRIAEIDEQTKKLEADAASARNVMDGRRMRIENREREAAEANDALTKQIVELRSADSRIAMLGEMEKEYEGFAGAVKTVMRESRRGTLRGVHGTVAELLRTDERCTLAIETALGAAIQNIVVDTQDDGRRAIEFLKRRDAGRATFLPIDTIRGGRLDRIPSEEEGCLGLAVDLVSFDTRYHNIFENLLGRTLVAETLSDAVAISRKNGNRVRIVTLDGQLINAGGSMTGGSAARNAGILPGARSWRNCRPTAASWRRRATSWPQGARSSSASWLSARYELDVATQELQSVNNELASLKAERRTTENAAAQLELLRQSISGDSERRGQGPCGHGGRGRERPPRAGGARKAHRGAPRQGRGDKGLHRRRHAEEAGSRGRAHAHRQGRAGEEQRPARHGAHLCPVRAEEDIRRDGGKTAPGQALGQLRAQPQRGGGRASAHRERGKVEPPHSRAQEGDELPRHAEPRRHRRVRASASATSSGLPARRRGEGENELLGIISDITGEMRTIFTREFTAINESFRETFTELFGGGKAELTLEPGEDVLTCDIDIKVQPPGKALTTLSLLSGGETAFVAIALYFAIIKVRPTPFCVMDEIEAALDEANVIRFAEHMRKIANRTQFIVITHRRGTMEEADFLYGVTMQEKGVSKVIELDLDEAEKHTEEAAG
ncbi:MAG: hypothetical protein ACLUFK_08265 [Oscillospiraceae bacterium]